MNLSEKVIITKTFVTGTIRLISTKINIQTSKLHKRGANYAKLHNQDGSIIYTSWKQIMELIK